MLPMKTTKNTPYSKFDMDTRLALMSVLKAAARDITLPLFESGLAAENKAESGYDPVTKADTDCERVLRDIIQKTFPQDSIHGEEFDDIHGSNDWLWTLDPIDGTRGFLAGIPVWSTLIAVSFKNAPILGLIDIGAQDKAFWGAPNRAWLETIQNPSIPLSTRECPTLKHGVLGCTEPLSMLDAGELAAYNIIRRGVRFSRLGLDAFGYAMVANGRMDIIIEAGLKPCDVRALMPVIEGAGGKLTNWHGGSAVDGGRVVAVGDAGLLPELYTYLGRAMTPG